MKRPLLIVTLLALGGCATTYTEPTLPADHPANAAAEQAPPPTRWQTLDLAAADPIVPAQAGAGMDHAGHGMGDNPPVPSTQPQPSGRGEESGAHKHEAPSSAPKQNGNSVGAALYACPMHPEVTSDRPDQRCPKCGMKLKKQDGGKQP